MVSILIPGPIVVDIVILRTYAPFADEGLSRNSVDNRATFKMKSLGRIEKLHVSPKMMEQAAGTLKKRYSKRFTLGFVGKQVRFIEAMEVLF